MASALIPKIGRQYAVVRSLTALNHQNTVLTTFPKPPSVPAAALTRSRYGPRRPYLLSCYV